MTEHAVENHGIIGDLRTVALVAMDGTLEVRRVVPFGFAQRTGARGR